MFPEDAVSGTLSKAFSPRFCGEKSLLHCSFAVRSSFIPAPLQCKCRNFFSPFTRKEAKIGRWQKGTLLVKAVTAQSSRIKKSHAASFDGISACERNSLCLTTHAGKYFRVYRLCSGSSIRCVRACVRACGRAGRSAHTPRRLKSRKVSKLTNASHIRSLCVRACVYMRSPPSNGGASNLHHAIFYASRTNKRLAAPNPYPGALNLT